MHNVAPHPPPLPVTFACIINEIPHLHIAHLWVNFEVGNIKIHLNDKVKIVRKLTQLRAHLSLYFCAAYNVIIDAVREGHCALIMICTEKSFAKALVSLWLAHISHRLHQRTMAVGWPCIWLQAITSSTAYLSNRGAEKAKPKTDFQTSLWTLWYFFIVVIMLGKLRYLLKCFNVKSSYTKYSRIIGFGWNSPYHISDNIGFLLSICA